MKKFTVKLLCLYAAPVIPFAQSAWQFTFAILCGDFASRTSLQAITRSDPESGRWFNRITNRYQTYVYGSRMLVGDSPQ